MFSIGPGLYKDTTAMISSNLSGFKPVKTSFIPEDSNWNIPVVDPVDNIS